MSDEAYHFPPDLLEQLVNAIPLLCRSKQNVLDFFRGCGVAHATLADLQKKVANDRTSISKYQIVRVVLTRLNEAGDPALGQRREVIKRVVEFHDFSVCWPEQQLQAKGLVASIRELVNVRDSFTRMTQERDSERREHQREQAAKAEAKRQRFAERSVLRQRLANLSSMSVPQQRGLAFEKVLNDIFKLDGLSVREAFTLSTEDGRQVGEQIDGLIVLDSHPVLVDAKWLAKPAGVPDVSRHLVRVFNRPSSVHGLIVSASGFATPAIEECKRALAQHVIMLAEVHELLWVLEEPTASLRKWLGAKLLAASVYREPLTRPGLDAMASA